MKTKLTRLEEGLVLVLDEPLVERLGLNEGTEVELSTSGDSFVVTPVRDAAR